MNTLPVSATLDYVHDNAKFIGIPIINLVCGVLGMIVGVLTTIYATFSGLFGWIVAWCVISVAVSVLIIMSMLRVAKVATAKEDRLIASGALPPRRGSVVRGPDIGTGSVAALGHSAAPAQPGQLGASGAVAGGATVAPADTFTGSNAMYTHQSLNPVYDVLASRK
jgi:hypothetical protein